MKVAWTVGLLSLGACESGSSDDVATTEGGGPSSSDDEPGQTSIDGNTSTPGGSQDDSTGGADTTTGAAADPVCTATCEQQVACAGTSEADCLADCALQLLFRELYFDDACLEAVQQSMLCQAGAPCDDVVRQCENNWIEQTALCSAGAEPPAALIAFCELTVQCSPELGMQECIIEFLEYGVLDALALGCVPEYEALFMCLSQQSCEDVSSDPLTVCTAEEAAFEAACPSFGAD
jgi:hypothetical protein